MTDEEQFHKRFESALAKAIRDNGKSLASLATASGFSSKLIASWFCGAQPPTSIYRFAKLCIALGISADDLLMYTDSYPPHYRDNEGALYALGRSGDGKWVIIRRNSKNEWKQMYVESFGSKRDADDFLRQKARSNIWHKLSR